MTAFLIDYIRALLVAATILSPLAVQATGGRGRPGGGERGKVARVGRAGVGVVKCERGFGR